MSTTTQTRTIQISQDGVHAGTGTLSPEGRIECAAVLGAAGTDHHTGAQQAAAERAYDAIEKATRAGRDTVTVDGVQYSWEIEEGLS